MRRLRKRIEKEQTRLSRGESSDTDTLRMLQAQNRMLLERAILEACSLQKKVDETKISTGQKLKMKASGVVHIMSRLRKRTGTTANPTARLPSKAPDPNYSNMYKHPQSEHEKRGITDKTDQIVRDRITSLRDRSKKKSDCDAQSDDDAVRVPAALASRGAGRPEQAMSRPKADEEEQKGTTQHALLQALAEAQSAQAQAQSAQAQAQSAHVQAQAHVSKLLALLAAGPPKALAASTPTPHGAKQGYSHAEFANERVDIEDHYVQASSRLVATTKSLGP